MKTKRVQKKINWTANDRARHKAIRDKFKDWHPGPEELLATGKYEGPFRQGAVLECLRTIAKLRAAREAAGLSLADVSRRSGMDKAALSRLENGHQLNPTLDTLWRYAAAVGKQIECRVVDAAAKR